MKQETKQKIKTYSIYTILFAILSFIIYFVFIQQGKSFIWKDDGFNQHFPILYNFNEIIRNSIQNGISTFSWNLGLGIDIIGQYSYYILGDPFAYLSLLFPMSKLELAYGVLIFIRMYFIGIAFLVYCDYNKKTPFNSILGAIIYTFCGFAVYAGARHPFFLNALIMLPLVMLGIDKIYKENKSIVFMFTIALIALMNYYFLYIITILAFIYAIVKYFCEYKEKGKKFLFNKFIKALISYIIGIMIAGVILLPTIYAYENSNRLGNAQRTAYTFKYYKTLFTGLTSNNSLHWTRICVSSIALIMIPISLLNKKEKENKTIITCIIIETIMLLFSIFGSLMNGFSFQSNRWTFGYAFLLSYMVVLNFKEDLKYSKSQIIYMLCTIILYTLILLCCDGVGRKVSLISISFALIMIFVIILNNKFIQKQNKFKYVIFILVVLNIIYYGRNLYSQSGKDYIDEFIASNTVIEKYNNMNDKIKNYDKAINNIKENDNGFYRISNNEYSNINNALIHKYNAINGYLSIGNRYVGTFSKDINNRTYNSDTNPLRELDSRTKITTLLANKYFIVGKGKNSYVPYGYEKVYELEEKTKVYENKNYLNLGVFYDNYMLKKDYGNLSSLEKEQGLLDTAVINNRIENIEYNKSAVEDIKNKTTYEIEYKIKDKDKILSKKEITTNKQNQSITLNINKAENCELYVQLKGFKYEDSKKYSIKFKYGNVNKIKKIRDAEEDPYYKSTDNILINLGYKKEHKGKIKITFSEIGKYKYDNIKVIAVPMDIYDESIQKLKQVQFDLTKCENGLIMGNIKNQKNGILQITTPYTNGWKAYVDGVETEILNVNIGFIGIPLKSGEHEITLKYETPYLKQGIVLSIVGLILSIGFIIVEKKFYSRQVTC